LFDGGTMFKRIKEAKGFESRHGLYRVVAEYKRFREKSSGHLY